MENVVLKSFPIFDMDQVEVIRGPQGTLFGRNNTAGIIKFNSRRPTYDLSGYFSGSYGTYATADFEAAAGGGLIDDVLAMRASVLYRTRDDWIDNGFTGEKDAMGNYDEKAARLQFLWSVGDSFEALLSLQTRKLKGTSSIVRANVFDTVSTKLNQT